MEKKEIKKRNQNQKGSEKKDEEDLLETLGEEVHLHLDEERQEKEKEMGELKKKLEEKEKEIKEYHDRLLRLAADFENYKKRAAKIGHENSTHLIYPHCCSRCFDHDSCVARKGI